MNSVLVTGCGRGLGLQISKSLAASGYRVIGVSRSQSAEYSSLMSEYKDSAFFYQYDFSDLSGIAKLVKRIAQDHGYMYGLVNNAALGHDGVLATMHERDISTLLDVNVKAPILLTKYVSRQMLLNQAGRIVNVGSIIGSTGFNGLSVYGASKAALGGFTKSLARELGKSNVTVNTLAPGYMETEMTSGLVGDKLQKIVRRSCLGRLATTDDAANMVVYLLSDRSSGVTGATFTIDAGSTA